VLLAVPPTAAALIVSDTAFELLAPYWRFLRTAL